MEDTTPQVIIEDDNPSDEQLHLAFERAKAEFGDCVQDYESDEFMEEFDRQVNLILTEEAIRGLIDKGIMVEGAEDGGEIGLRLTSLGQDLGKLATTT